MDRQLQELVYLSPQCKERFITQEGVPEFSRQGIHMAGIAELFDEYYVERSKPEHHTLIFTLTGQGQLRGMEVEEVISAQTLTVLPAGQGFRFDLDQYQEQPQWQIAWLLIDPLTSKLPIAKFNQQVQHYPLSEQIWALLSMLFHDMQHRPKQRSKWVNELNGFLQRALVSNTEDHGSKERVMEVFSQVEAQLHQDWSVARIAALSYLSEVQLTRLCHQLYQRSPRQRLIQLRMEKAAELLRYSQWNIGYIASLLGYSDPYNFSHRFRRYHGVSPRQFRQAQE
ncbi:helix-turn-helix transcriptional regulator [Aliagarivorans taiwanensis]|uniref:helix-turn-helix transcriptional regulator n=1 Tax=Aliagarivorans taiwanensis TaxID=561966 RepID=UPI00054F4C0C|nr:AraC family transcriptional regulator [Aliagarivorans taiwanensis]